MNKILKALFWAVFSFGLVAAVSITAGGIYLSMVRRNEPEEPLARLSTEVQELPRVEDEEEPTLSDVIERALPSVVGISCASGTGSSYNMGSGVIATEDGYIITNQHVIGSGAGQIAVTLMSGDTRAAREIWSDAALDLAVIKIEGGRFTPAALGNAEELRVGERVAAIGNPLSMQFERTVTAGIVSAVGRSITIESGGSADLMEDLIQTDASINPGNSGGPLINSDGEVIGINTIKVSSAEGMGFAVPINLCVPVIERISRTGEFETPYLGLYAYTGEAARYMGAAVSFTRGLYVAQLDASGPAFEAGLRYGDVIVYADGAEVGTMLALREKLFAHQSGESIRLSFMRDATLHEVAVTLAAQPKAY